MDEAALADWPIHGDSTEFLAALLDCVSPSLVCVDLELRVLSSNRSYTDEVRRRVLGSSLLDYLPREGHPAVIEAFETVRSTCAPVSFEARGRDLAGRPAVFAVRAAPWLVRGELKGFVVHAVDVTRSRTDESRLELAVRATGIGLWSFDVASGAIEWNQEMHDITGSPTALTPDRWVQEFVHPEDRDRAIAETRQSMSTGVMTSSPHRIVRPDGTVRSVMVLGSFEFGAHGAPVFVHGVTIDITEEKRREEALQGARRFEAVGHLAAGIAHNFNNLLAVIVPLLDEIAEVVPDEHVPGVADARLAATRAIDLVKQIVSFARFSQDVRAETLDLGKKVVPEALRVAHRATRAALRIETDLGDERLLVRAPPGQIEQVILNLVTNARDAVVDSGRTTGQLHVRLRAAGGTELPPGIRNQGAFARLSIEDDGPGMSSATRERIFDPFFTTKEPGRGTGLGLSTAQATLERLGGLVECESVLGEGTTFHLYFPLVEATARKSELPLAESVRSGAALRVLVVDDEDLVRRSIVTILNRGGMVPIAVAGGQAALEAIERDHVDVALLDRSMPGMDGITLARHLRADHPSLPLVLVTGGTVSEEEEALFDLVVGKPVRSRDLLDVVRRVNESRA